MKLRLLALAWILLALATLALVVREAPTLAAVVTAWFGGVVTRDIWSEVRGDPR